MIEKMIVEDPNRIILLLMSMSIISYFLKSKFKYLLENSDGNLLYSFIRLHIYIFLIFIKFYFIFFF